MDYQNDIAQLGPDPSAAQAPTPSGEQAKVKRQPLSCFKCRQRKVKCDRVKPCQACCVRGQPRECDFAVGENDDTGPINQAHEIRRLRAENSKLRTANLKHRERSALDSQKTDNRERGSDGSGSPERKCNAPKIPKKPARFQQKRFKALDPSDNLYFGSPGLANVIAEFANLQIGSGPAPSVTYAAPRGLDIFTYNEVPMYAFPTLWRADAGATALLDCLPPRDELFEYLDAFQRRAQSCSFPHVPEEITRKEIERFLSDARNNAFKHPDMLALIFAALAQGLQNGVYDKSGGKWVEGAMEAEAWKGDLYIAAAMQALRIASFMNRPTILVVETLIMIGPYLTNSGKFLDAWTLFGTTIRVAQSMGLHRSPQHLDPAPLLSECRIRQALWWWMLHMDQQYSMTLGRPLGISGIGDCPPPEPLTTNPTILRVSEYINNFTLMARQILSSDRLNNSKIDDFTDRLLGLRDTLPDIVQFDGSWLDQSKPIPEWPLDALAAVFHGKTHNYLILLNRQRQENDPTSSGEKTSSRETSTGSSPVPSATTGRLRGRDRVLASARALLEAFAFFHQRVQPGLICWTMGQQAFNSAMILLLGILRPVPDRPASADSLQIDYHLVHQAYATFTEMHQKGIHKLAGLACSKLSPLLIQLGPLPSNQNAAGTAGTAATNTDAPMGPAQNPYAPTDLPAPSFTLEEDVMGNTGMLLLEDPGLQNFIPEAFAPLNFQMAGDDLPISGMGDVEMSHGGSGDATTGSAGAGAGPTSSDTFMAMGAGLSSPGWAARGALRESKPAPDPSGLGSGLDAARQGPGEMGSSQSTPGATQLQPPLPTQQRPEVRQKPDALKTTYMTSGSVSQA